MKTKTKGNILTDTLETLVEPIKPIPKDIAKGVGSIVDINALIYGKTEEPPPTEKQHLKSEKAILEFGVDEKTRKENEVMKANSTPFDAQALRDKQQIAQIKKRLFDIQKNDGEKAIKEADEKEQARKKAEADEEEEKKKKEEKERAAQAQPEEDAHGKSKAKPGQARKKATTDPHQNFEQKSNKGK